MNETALTVTKFPKQAPQPSSFLCVFVLVCMLLENRRNFRDLSSSNQKTLWKARMVILIVGV